MTHAGEPPETPPTFSASSRPCTAELDRLFLDSGVLFSTAYRKDVGVRRLWGLPEDELVTSSYAAEEARRNLASDARRSDLEGLLEAVRVSNLLTDSAEHPEIEDSGLPEKDLLILRAAVATNATRLITSDRKHFGHLLGKRSPAASYSAQPLTCREEVSGAPARHRTTLDQLVLVRIQVRQLPRKPPFAGLFLFGLSLRPLWTPLDPSGVMVTVMVKTMVRFWASTDTVVVLLRVASLPL